MTEPLPIGDVSRQPLIKGTTRYTEPTGYVGFSNEDIQTSALVRIAAALETQTSILLATRAGFTEEQQASEENHIRVVREPGQRLIQIDVLATSPKMASVLSVSFTRALKAIFEMDEQQKGGQANG